MAGMTSGNNADLSNNYNKYDGVNKKRSLTEFIALLDTMKNTASDRQLESCQLCILQYHTGHDHIDANFPHTDLVE